jgi:hypothetical protein
MKNKIKTKKITIVSTIFLSQIFTAQYVGINTTTPEKELDINGELKIRTIKEETALTGNEKILIVHKTEKVIKEIDPNLLQTNTSVLAAKKEGNLTLLNLSFDIYNTWKIVNFQSNDITTGNNSNFSNATYTVPSTGVYKIGYYFRYGNGIQATLLSTQPLIGILKTTGNTLSVLDSREFQGISIPLLLSLNLTENNIDYIYPLQADDKLVFGINTGGISLGLLNESSASVYIYKISN